MNAIYTNQSTRENLDLLYAQARVYDRVNWKQTEFSLLASSRTAPAFFRYRIQPEPEFVDSELLSSLSGSYMDSWCLPLTLLSVDTSGSAQEGCLNRVTYDCRVLGIRRNELKVEVDPDGMTSSGKLHILETARKHESDLARGVVRQ